MKRKKRVAKAGRVASIKASADLKQGRLAYESEQWAAWREKLLELRHWRKTPKKRVTLKLDADVLAWLRGMGRGYQWRINRALRKDLFKMIGESYIPWCRRHWFPRLEKRETLRLRSGQAVGHPQLCQCRQVRATVMN